MSGRSDNERIGRLVSDPRYRAVLTALEDADGPLRVRDLAERLLDRDDAPLETAASESELERLLVSLHHDRLPKLADVGLVEYDQEANVAKDVSSTVDAEWLDADIVADLVARFEARGAIDESAIGVVEGRENVVDYGRRLADEAEDELFLMYVSDDLLKESCLEHAKDAIERGVDIYMGSQNSTVCDLTRRHLPEATLWEPQLDWMNVPSRYPTIGRLVLADREKVMLAMLDEPEANGTSGETAVVGTGQDNPLVVLVRELLGPRLDHLDYQSEEFRSELPF